MPRAAVGPVLDLGADLGVTSTFSVGLSSVAALAARATARGLREVGIADAAGRASEWFDAYVAAIRAADAVCAARLRCGLAVGVLDVRGRLDLPADVGAQLSRLDHVLLRPYAGPARPGTERAVEDRLLAAVRAAAALPVPAILATPFAGLDERELPDATVREFARALARAGLPVLVDERLRSPGRRVATLLAGAGVRLVAGSGARSAADLGRWEHVAAVAAALPAGPDRRPRDS